MQVSLVTLFEKILAERWQLAKASKRLFRYVDPPCLDRTSFCFARLAYECDLCGSQHHSAPYSWYVVYTTGGDGPWSVDSQEHVFRINFDCINAVLQLAKKVPPLRAAVCELALCTRKYEVRVPNELLALIVRRVASCMGLSF
jgi:hypothetical protein